MYGFGYERTFCLAKSTSVLYSKADIQWVGIKSQSWKLGLGYAVQQIELPCAIYFPNLYLRY